MGCKESNQTNKTKDQDRQKRRSWYGIKRFDTDSILQRIGNKTDDNKSIKNCPACKEFT